MHNPNPNPIPYSHIIYPVDTVTTTFPAQSDFIILAHTDERPRIYTVVHEQTCKTYCCPATALHLLGLRSVKRFLG